MNINSLIAGEAPQNLLRCQHKMAVKVVKFVIFTCGNDSTTIIHIVRNKTHSD